MITKFKFYTGPYKAAGFKHYESMTIMDQIKDYLINKGIPIETGSITSDEFVTRNATTYLNRPKSDISAYKKTEIGF